MGDTASVQAIDVHAHLGAYVDEDPQMAEFMSGDAERVVSLAARARTGTTVISSLRALLPPGRYDTLAGNEDVLREVEQVDGLRMWAVLEPRLPESFAQVKWLLGHPRCLGIKIHPELHGYAIAEYGHEVFAFAARHGAVVQSHSGDPYCLPEDFLPFADSFPEVTLILSHLGWGHDGLMAHQVRAVQRSRHGNVYADTSSSRSIVPGLIEWAVREVGAERILYGTDSPLYFAPMQRARIDQAEMPDEAKRVILRGNAERLLGLTE